MDDKLIKENMSEQLLTKNNIDFIYNEISNINDRNKKLNWIEIIKVPLVALSIAISFGIPIFFINNLIYKILFGIASTKFLILTGVTLKQCLKMKKDLNLSSKLQTRFLKSECEEELEKLKQFESIFNEKVVENSKSVSITRSERIENLKHKLKLINDYSNNKKEYMSLYNNNSLNLLKELYNYSEDDILFIKIIMEEDLRSNVEKNNIVKIKNLKKQKNI